MRVVDCGGVADGGFDAVERGDAVPLAAVDHVVAVLGELAVSFLVVAAGIVSRS